MIDYIDETVELLEQQHRIYGVQNFDEARRLWKVEDFVRQSTDLKTWDRSGRNRSLEDRMEDLLVKYGYDKLNKKPVGCEGKGKGRE